MANVANNQYQRLIGTPYFFDLRIFLDVTQVKLVIGIATSVKNQCTCYSSVFAISYLLEKPQHTACFFGSEKAVMVNHHQVGNLN